MVYIYIYDLKIYGKTKKKPIYVVLFCYTWMNYSYISEKRSLLVCVHYNLKFNYVYSLCY